MLNRRDGSHGKARSSFESVSGEEREGTVAAGQGAAPLEVGLTLQGLAVAQGVPGVAAEGHQSAHVEVIAVPLAVDGDARVHAVIRLQLHSCRIGPREICRHYIFASEKAIITVKCPYNVLML